VVAPLLQKYSFTERSAGMWCALRKAECVSRRAAYTHRLGLAVRSQPAAEHRHCLTCCCLAPAGQTGCTAVRDHRETPLISSVPRW
jgi:hypothetical protein